MAPPDGRRATGAAAEAAVEDYLVAQGYAIEARNWQCRTGELDIVASIDDVLAFVEVRSATTDFLETPAATVLPGKQARVARAADTFLRAFGLDPPRVRFDVAAVTWQDGKPSIEYFENAFVPRSAF